MIKNVAILIPQLTDGGAERVASNLSLYLPGDKYKKYLVVYDTEKIDYPYDCELINLNVKPAISLLRKIVNVIRRIYKLRQIKKKYDIQTTVSLLSGANLVNILSRRNDKVIISVRNYLSKSSSGVYGFLFKLSIKFLYNKADKVVVVSKAIKDNLVKNFGLEESKIKVIYNPYDLEKIKKLAKEEIEEEYINVFKNPTVITVGRLSKQKGHWHLIRTFKKVKEEIPDAKLVILGQGELKKYLMQLTIDLGLEKDVYFLGFRKNPFKYIARSTIYAFPSLYEGFPNALCEAMACGIPVISSDCKSGPREILAPNTDINKETFEIEKGEYGILVPVCDGRMYRYYKELTREEEQLGISIVELIKNNDIWKNYSARALNRVSEFDKEKIISIWETQM